MKLINILELVNENINIIVLKDENIVSIYDGKNAIDENLNNETITYIDIENNKLYIHL